LKTRPSDTSTPAAKVVLVASGVNLKMLSTPDTKRSPQLSKAKTIALHVRGDDAVAPVGDEFDDGEVDNSLVTRWFHFIRANC
jgi:hypothetical protein